MTELIKFALVEFPREKRARYVVKLGSIHNFKPKTKDEFDPADKWQVKWPVEPNDNSKSSEYYEGRVLLLAASEESMVYLAKEKNVRLPRGYAELVSKKSGEPDSKFESSKRIAGTGKDGKKLVKMKEDRVSSKRKRFEAIAAAHVGGDLFSPAQLKHSGVLKTPSDGSGGSIKHGSYNLKPLKSGGAEKCNDESFSKEEVAEVGGLVESSTEAGSLMTSGHPPSFSSGTRDSSSTGGETSKGNVLEGTRGYIADLSDVESQVGMETTCSMNLAFQKRDGSEGGGKTIFEDSLDGNKFLLEGISPSKKSQGKKRYPESDLETEVDDVSYVSSNTELNRVQEQLAEAQRQLAGERKANRKLKTQLQQCQDLLSHVVSRAQSIFSEEDEDESTKEGGPASAVKRTLFLDDNAVLHSPKKARWIVHEAAGGSPERHQSTINHEVAPKNKASKSPKKILMKRSPGKSPKTSTRKQKEKTALGDGEKTSKEMAPLLLAAMTGKTSLPQTSKKRVYLGNDVAIKATSWTYLSTSTQKLQIQVQNLAEAIWGWQQCAKLSLSGGISPKTPDADRKPAAPAGKVEVVKAFVCAKLMAAGHVSEDQLLDETTQQIASIGLRTKFQNSFKKLKKEIQRQSETKERENNSSDDNN